MMAKKTDPRQILDTLYELGAVNAYKKCNGKKFEKYTKKRLSISMEIIFIKLYEFNPKKHEFNFFEDIAKELFISPKTAIVYASYWYRIINSITGYNVDSTVFKSSLDNFLKAEVDCSKFLGVLVNEETIKVSLNKKSIKKITSHSVYSKMPINQAVNSIINTIEE